MTARNEKVLLSKLDQQAMECFQTYVDGMVKTTLKSLETNHKSLSKVAISEFIAKHPEQKQDMKGALESLINLKKAEIRQQLVDQTTIEAGERYYSECESYCRVPKNDGDDNEEESLIKELFEEVGQVPFDTLQEHEKESYRRHLSGQRRRWLQEDRKACLKNDRAKKYVLTGYRFKTRSYWFPKLPTRKIDRENKRYLEQLSISLDEPSSDDLNISYCDDEAVDKAYANIFEAQKMLERACGVAGLTRGNVTVAGKTEQLEKTLAEEVPRLESLVKEVEEIKHQCTELVRQKRALQTDLDRLERNNEDTSVVQQELDSATLDVANAETRLEEAKKNGTTRQDKLKNFLSTHVEELEEELLRLQNSLDATTQKFTLKEFKMTSMGDKDFDTILIESKAKCLAEFERLGCAQASNYLESITDLEREIFQETRIMYAVCFSKLHHVMDKFASVAKLVGQVIKPRLNMGLFAVDIFN